MSSGNDDNFDPNMFNFDDDTSTPEGSLGDLPGADAMDPLAAPSDSAVSIDSVAAEEPAEEPADGKKKGRGKRKAKARKEKKPKAAKVKKEKKSKTAKTPKPKREKGESTRKPGDLPIAACVVMAILALLAGNGYVLMNYGLASITFFALMNFFGLVLVAVPVVCWLGRERMNVYDVFLGISVSATVVIALLLLIGLAHYNGELKPAVILFDSISNMLM